MDQKIEIWTRLFKATIASAVLALFLQVGIEIQALKNQINTIKEDRQCLIEYYEDKLAEERTKVQNISESLKHPYKLQVTDSLTKEIYSYMKEKLVCPEANLALASHESDHFRSSLFKKSYNMFCVGYTPNRYSDFKVWSRGDGHYKMGWNNWKSAIDDMAEWQKSRIEKGILDPSSNEAYIQSLRKANYATDPYHGKKVLSHYHKLFIKEDPVKIIELYATL